MVVAMMLEKYYYDLHIHSCLSPCGDDDMTPNNIAGMAALKGLQVLALTDHNTCKNCPAFFAACKKQGIIPIAGAEVTTAEDIHAVCLFPTLEAAMEFDRLMDEKRVRIKNEPDIFGRQQIMDGEDNVIGEEEYLLINALDVYLDDLYGIARSLGGIAYPAHLDKDANGVLAMLGTIPDHPDFRVAEFHDLDKRAAFEERFPFLAGKLHLENSDAHYLWEINEAESFLPVAVETYSSENVRRAIFRLFTGEDKI